MKHFLYWFLGDTAGRTIVAWWNWLWGKPLESGGEVTLEAAKESLAQMQGSVQKLTESVSRVMAVYQQAQGRYEVKKKELSHAEEQAGLAMDQGNDEATRIAIARVISLEQLLPQLQERVEQAQNMKRESQQKLQAEREKLEACKLEMGNLKAISEMNEALNQVMTLTSEFGLDTARSQFDDSEQAIKNRHLQINSQFELSRNPHEQFEQQLNQLSQADAIEQRLQKLRRQKEAHLKAVPDIRQTRPAKSEPEPG
ncbi:PspA/IM30 family protein [Acaryochloris marina]|uniref:PspA/IM30 family protein n=1 Tax=Acaryochloris marina TaxID=155978 RepID=UPI001BB051F4|nr:PspA/IM30 family protein [Acaryochloris marina]QUY44382.1 PspA/IM30 family protein [Acaryochloris marina S15]